MFHNKIYILAATLSIFLTACAVGPNFHPPAAPETSQYTERPLPSHTVGSPGPGGKVQQFLPGKDIPAQWWLVFRSEALNNLIEQGLAHSPNLKAAEAALRQAKENLYAEFGATMFPNISGQFSVERQRFSSETFGTTTPVVNTFNLFNASVNASYTIDVFGGNRRQIEAFRALYDYQGFQKEVVYLTLTSNIVTTAITEASLRAQIKVTQELIQIEEKLLQITRQRFQLGGVSKADILTQQTSLAQTRATLPPLEKSLAQNRHALAALVGSLPSEDQLPNFYLHSFQLPRSLPVSLPSQMVCQRPDVRAAEALLHQASAQVGVATANLLPQFPLSASYGTIANKINMLFTPQSVVWDIMAQVVQPIFNGGSLHAKRRAAIAAYEEAYAQYRQVVLQAFQNVADVLSALEIDAQTLKAETEAENAARAAFLLTAQQFKLGGVNYLNLLIAESQYQQTRLARIKAAATRYADTAALFQALGGGWWNREILVKIKTTEVFVVKN